MKNKPLSAYEYSASTFTGMVARAVVELVVEPVETLPRHRVAATEGSPRSLRARADGGVPFGCASRSTRQALC